MNRAVLAATAIASLIVLASCSSDDNSSARPAPEDTAQVPTASQESDNASSDAFDDNGATAYFEDLATNEATAVERAASLAAPGSFAAGYAQHRANVWATNLDHGYDAPGASEVSVDDSSAEVCQPDAPEDCSTFSDFTYNDAKLAGFTIEGVDIGERLVMGDGTVVKSKDVAGFELLSAYQSVTDNTLTAVFRFHSYDRPIDTSYVATYRDPTGRQVQDTESILPSTLVPDSNQLALVRFPRAEVGGEFILKFATSDEKDPLIVEEVPVSSAPAK